jgi:hypothetical protein
MNEFIAKCRNQITGVLSGSTAWWCLGICERCAGCRARIFSEIATQIFMNYESSSWMPFDVSKGDFA